jgi:hypothetical protein
MFVARNGGWGGGEGGVEPSCAQTGGKDLTCSGECHMNKNAGVAGDLSPSPGGARCLQAVKHVRV